MNILILHHVESMWEEGYAMYGTSFHQVLEDIADHLEVNEYDRVILTRFEDVTLEPEHWLIADHISTVEAYAYGWERIELEYTPDDFCPGGTHSEVVYLAPWMRELPKTGVHIAGAFDGECIDDLETALEYLEIDYQRIETLIV